MIAAILHRSGGHKEAHVQGWIISVLLHGAVAFTAILLMKQVQLVPKDEAFKWNVAMVSPAQHVQPTAMPQNQTQARSVPSTTPVPPPPVQRSAPAPTLPSPQPLAQQTTPSISERTATPTVTEYPVPPSTQQTAPSLSATHTTQPTEPDSHEIVAPKIAEATSIEKPAEASMARSTEPPDQTGPSSAPTAILEQTAQSDAAPAPMQTAAISTAPPSNAPAKRDYGWLSEAILRRVEELKRYPASARVDRAEGKVVVKAVINEDGSIGEVNVVQSSGYPTLDEAAVETMQRAAPFQLPHPLGQPRMTIKIPMSYRLDR